MVTGGGANRDHDRDIDGREADLDDGGHQRAGDRDGGGVVGVLWLRVAELASTSTSGGHGLTSISDAASSTLSLRSAAF
jgi:hypothetical protein